MASNLPIPSGAHEAVTDYSRWRLENGSGGRHTWHYLRSDAECERWPQSDIDKYWLGLPTNAPVLASAKDPFEAASNGFSFFKRLQAHDGHWPGEYGGPMFILPGFVIGSYVSGLWFEEEERLEMIRYLFSRAHPDDGGWGLHVEGRSTVLGTSLNYCSLRLLGVDLLHPVLIKARETLHRLGGAAAVPSWGKFWLSVLNVYEWDGVNPGPPEIWLLPEWVPFHPRQWWIHMRAVCLPLGYLYRVKFKCEIDDTLLSLREELYTVPYDSIDWPAQRNNIAQADLYKPHSFLFDVINTILGLTLESCPFPPLQRAALQHSYAQICMEDENTAYQCIGPVSKMMHVICRRHAEGVDSDAVRQHALKRADFLWMGPDGMRVCAIDGSQLWDLAFMAQALCETGLADIKENRESLGRVLDWLDKAQITDNPCHFERAYRQATKGAWGFSTKEQGYTLTDCTAGALKSVLYLQNRRACINTDSPKPVSAERLYDSVDLLLSMQGANGGFASYEKMRGSSLLEYLSHVEVFGNAMVEYAYPECTSSVITSFDVFRKYHPEYRRGEINIQHAVQYLQAAQHPEGGWYGSWGICFTYGTMFAALEGLAIVGQTYETSAHVRRACHFLLDKQMSDGGWGESYQSCVQERYVHHEKSQVVATSWAALALMHARYPHRGAIERAVRLLMSRQQPDGSWAQEAIEGIFNQTCALAYPNFKHIFTTWMLGMAHKYLKGEVVEIVD